MKDPLPIHSVEFVGGMATPDGWRPPPDLPEVAFAGRSNVGKSSLMNRLVRRRAMARVSGTPGRTREINFFRVNDAFMLVDLPGYGYARASQADRARWRPLVESYLRTSLPLRGLVQLLDPRREPTDDDRRMLEWLGELGVPVLVAVTKVDKLRAAAVEPRLRELAMSLSLDQDHMIPVSSRTGAGRDDLAAAVASLLTQPPWRTL